jgi:ATP-dependent DNA helicase DinG
MTPGDMGLPPKFAVWRPGQQEAMTDATKCLKRFCIQVVPTGVGKSLIYMSSALKRCKRTVILTSTKGLQDQLVRDFGAIGLVEIKGRKNYRCRRGDGPTADDGLCHLGVDCQYKAGGCPYFDALRIAKKSRYVVTNYAMWLSCGDFLKEDTEVLIMDEAHAAPDHLSDFMSAEIDLEWIGEVLGKEQPVPDDWGDWVSSMYPVVGLLIEQGLKHPDMNLKRLRQLYKVKRTLDNLYRIRKSPLVVEKVKDKYQIDPLTLIRYAEPYLFMGTPFVHLTSATVTRYTAKTLGISNGDYWIGDYPSPFPVANRRVIYSPAVKVDRNITEGERLLWLARMDNIIKPRLNRKGIIHTVSYDRAWQIIRGSNYGKYGIVHDAYNTNMKVQAFKHRKAPAFLVSPSMSTGWDFPYSNCEWQIIAKVPFPDSRSLIMQERQKLDSELAYNIAWQTIIQAAGRGCRAEDDKCETFIIDKHFGWLHTNHGYLAPRWFLEAIQYHTVLPKPLPKLEK